MMFIKVVGRYMVSTIPRICLPISTSTSREPDFVSNMVDLHMTITMLCMTVMLYLVMLYSVSSLAPVYLWLPRINSIKSAFAYNIRLLLKIY